MKTTTTTTTTTGKKPPRAPFPPALCTRRSSARAPTAWRRDYSTASHNLHPRVDSESTAECSSRYRPPTTFPTSRASSVKRQASAVRRQWRARERGKKTYTYFQYIQADIPCRINVGMITASLKLHRGRLERILRPKPQAQPIGQPRIRRTIRPLNRPYPMKQRVPTGKRRTRIILRAHKAHQLLLQSLRAVRRPRRR